MSIFKYSFLLSMFYARHPTMGSMSFILVVCVRECVVADHLPQARRSTPQLI